MILPPQALERAWEREHLRLHRHLLRRPELLPRGASLLLAVSGGQDSMALLGLLLGLRRLHHWQLRLWHGDHGWRSESGRQAEALQAWCNSQNLEVQCHRWSPEPDQGASGSNSGRSRSETQARQWRYQALQHTALAAGCSHVVTGHTASDRAETLLLNLARGSHRRGLGSLRALRPLNGDGPSGIQLSRPLLIFSRDETARICRTLGLPIWVDSSNNDRRYSRNRLRQDVLPVLEQLHPGAIRRLSGTAERLEQDHDHAAEWVHVALQWLTCGESQEPHQVQRLDRSKLVALQPANQAAVLELWLRQHGIGVGTADQLGAILSRLQEGQPPGRVDLAGGWQLHWNRSTLDLIAPTHAAP